ncbi:hypothetical protein DPEC_G00228680 [Dallia pectoralis]|uniref:Uncharacterized protein n=1 Tax=Dallia pectoralis TaxID=75939 RepID=A0ACC2G1A4_DALPE|nr:hypothetical protein DPEC_G00228680 [Dallia pectoralis]
MEILPAPREAWVAPRARPDGSQNHQGTSTSEVTPRQANKPLYKRLKGYFGRKKSCTMVEEISAVERQTMVEEISAVERQTMVEEISAVERQTMVEEISSCASNNVDLPSVTKATLLNPRARSSGRRRVFVNPFTKGRRSWMKIRLQRCWDDVHQLIRPQKMGRIGPVKHWNKVVLTPTLDTILEEETPEEAEQARKTEKDDRYFLLAEDDTCWSTFLYCLRLLWESFGIC